MTEKTDNEDIEEEVSLEEDGAQRASLRIRRLLPNRRIDKYLQHRFPDFSRTMIQRLIKEKGITVNGGAVKCSYQLMPGDHVDLVLPPLPTNEIPPEDIPLDIIFEDEHILVINKQANLIVHPARGNRGGTLVNGLVYYSNSLSTVNSEFRPGIVHRLDRNTTGVILVAKTDTAHWRVAHQFEHRLTQKAYVAIVHGTLELDADLIDLPLGRHPKIREKYAVRPDIGKPSTTVYHVEKQFNGYALMRLLPKTGRTHQLRVHMSTIKHPIVADDMYGGKMMTMEQITEGQAWPTADEPGGEFKPGEHLITRQALHAAELTIRHPISGEKVCFKAELPEDMKTLLKLLERYRSLDD
ncbi:MAG: RluA family pseudouridine synthase [Phycisphaerae bacterium]|nr:RluA family pseudouridine synthase [Phycisphaerae bacterium]